MSASVAILLGAVAVVVAVFLAAYGTVLALSAVVRTSVANLAADLAAAARDPIMHNRRPGAGPREDLATVPAGPLWVVTPEAEDFEAVAEDEPPARPCLATVRVDEAPPFDLDISRWLGSADVGTLSRFAAAKYRSRHHRSRGTRAVDLDREASPVLQILATARDDDPRVVDAHTRALADVAVAGILVTVHGDAKAIRKWLRRNRPDVAARLRDGRA